MVELISIHIPKTAGTAFRHVLLNVYGLDGVLEDYPPDKIHQPETSISHQIQVIHGHFSPKKYNSYFTDAKRMIWLRHPIFRLISEYFYALTIQDKNNNIHRQLLENNLSLLQFAEIPAMRDFQIKKLQGMKLSEFDFVGLQEFYVEDLQELKTLFNWSNFKITVQNSNTYPHYYKKLQAILSDHPLMNQLATLNVQDMALYQEALYLRAKRREESKLLQPTLAEWNRSSFFLKQLQDNIRNTENELNQLKYWVKKTQSQAKTLEIVQSPRAEVSAQLWGFNFDAPQSPIVVNGSPVTLRGWVIGKTSPLEKIVLTNQGKILSETVVNISRPDVAKTYSFPGAQNCGFEILIGVNGISKNSELSIQAIFEDQTQVKLGIVRPQNAL